MRRFKWSLAAWCVLACGPHANVPPQPSWEIACGDNRVDAILDDFDSSWLVFTAGSAIPVPTLAAVAGCHGSNALAVSYNLNTVQPPEGPNPGQSWIVLVKNIAQVNLTGYTHIRLSMTGSNINSHETVEVKLRDSSNRLHALALRSMTDVPAWRPIYVDFRELTGAGTLDLANITSLEIGITRCVACEVADVPGVPQPPDEHTGTLSLDEFAVVNLKIGVAHRPVQTAFDGVPPNAAARAAAANAILARIVSSGPGASLSPAWYPEANPNFNSYVQAEALLVFVYEYERTGNTAFRDAAVNLAARLLGLQIPPGRAQAGAWHTAYTIEGGVLVPPVRGIPETNPPRCDGDETMIADPSSGVLVANNIDTCEWVGNVGWVVTGLSRLRRAGFYPDAATLHTAITRGADWIAGQSAYRGNGSTYPGLISLGIEGNLSAYFGLRAAGRDSQAAVLGDAIFTFGWDATQRRMKPGVGAHDAATAIDVSGSWGVTFLRASGRRQEALDSMAYSAAIMRTVSFNGTIRGYGDIAGPFTPAVEFTGQAAAAGITDAAFVMEQMLGLADATYGGAFRGAADHWYGGALNPWATTMAGVSPTAWVYFAFHLDPLLARLPFTDESLSAGSTSIRAVHIRELRERIDRLRAAYGLVPTVWTDATLTPDVTVIKAVHVQQLRGALCGVYNVVTGYARPAFCNPPELSAGSAIIATHITELRDAAMAIE